MRHRSRRPYLFKLSARLLVFGLWTVMFGLLILYFSVKTLASVPSVEASVLGTESSAAGSSATGMALSGMLIESMVMLYKGGFVTLGVGGVLMAFGSMFIIGIAR